MLVGFVEWPDELKPNGREMDQIRRTVADAKLDMLVTNELPFGAWIARAEQFDRDVAQQSIDLHEEGLAALSALSVPAVITSRPIWKADRLCNEAVSVEDGVVKVLHRKRYFPAEPGWFESSWYVPGEDEFPIAEVGGMRVGTLLCTELMFNERARRYGRAKTSIIVVPRATGSAAMWRVAGQMAAIVSGSYVVSSNRVSTSGAFRFAGEGFAYDPSGKLIGMTDQIDSLAVIDVDPLFVERQQQSYPCYVSDMHGG